MTPEQIFSEITSAEIIDYADGGATTITRPRLDLIKLSKFLAKLANPSA